MFSQIAAVEEAVRVGKIFKLLEKNYPRAKTALVHGDPFQLVVATILSAQTTDAQVNRITKELFARAATPGQMAQLEPAQLEPYLRGCGLYRQKSRFLVEASRRIMDEYGGRVPERFADLVSLPGVGRKTANVILSSGFGRPALAVDTHVFRVARRLGLAAGSKTEQVERELKKIIHPREWGAAHHRLIAHGRALCRAQRPRCGGCFLRDHCPSKQTLINGTYEEAKEWPGKS